MTSPHYTVVYPISFGTRWQGAICPNAWPPSEDTGNCLPATPVG